MSINQKQSNLHQLKVLLLISTLVFTSARIGPLSSFLPLIAVASALLLGVTSWLLFQQANDNLIIIGVATFTNLIFIWLGLITIAWFASGDANVYQANSPRILWVALVNAGLALVLLREKP